MTIDAYWDELGIAWCAIKPEIDVITPRLKSRLRRQSFFIVASLVMGALLSVAGFLLGIFTIWSGWTTATWNFVTRGVGIMAISAMLAIAMSLLWPVKASDNAKALSEMLDLAIARAERTLKTIRLGLYACIAAAVLGTMGAAIRTYLARPPALSPVVDLAMLAIFALGLFHYGRHTRTDLAKFRHLKHTLAIDEI